MPRFQDTEYKITRRLASELQELLVARFSCAMALAMFVRDKLGRGIVNEISRGNSVQPSSGELVSQCRRRACIGVLVEHLQAMGGSYALSQFIGYLCEAGYLHDTESGAFSDGEDNWSLERQRGFVRFEKGDLQLVAEHVFPCFKSNAALERFLSRNTSAAFADRFTDGIDRHLPLRTNVQNLVQDLSRWDKLCPFIVELQKRNRGNWGLALLAVQIKCVRDYMEGSMVVPAPS